MKPLALLFADLTKYTGLIALGFALIVNCWRLALARAEQKMANSAFATLALQTRLGQLSAELRDLETCPSYARSFKVQAASLAYDGLLAEACKRAGISPDPQLPCQDLERLRKERALSAAGWSW